MKKNILITVYDMEIGGIERSLINMLNSFDFEQYSVDLFIFEHKGDLLKLIPKQVHLLPEINKYTIFRKPIKQCLREGHYALAFTRVISKYLANLKASFNHLKEGSGYIQMQLALKYAMVFLPKLANEYDAAISYAWPHDVVIKKVKAKKKIAWIHTDYTHLEIDNHIDLTIWSKFDHIISISEECTTAFLTTYPILKDKILLIENITTPQFIKEMALKSPCVYGQNPDTFNIISVGRLSYAKGFDLAIQALRLLRDKGFGKIKWYVVGYGPEEQSIKALISSYHLEDDFILLGKQTNPYPYIQEADLYVQPSRYEGKAITVTEAKILGKPILITKYPTANSQLVNGIEGILCDLDPEGIASGIEYLYQDAHLRERLTEQLKSKDYRNGDELDKLYRVINTANQAVVVTEHLKEGVHYDY